jgi:uncharacterized coiled-coil protein SlyX
MTIEAFMHLALGLLIALFVGLLLLPAYKRRTVRLTSEAIKRSMPLTEAEIRADKDRLRAEYVLSLHDLETKLEKATLAHARQRVDINRRDAAISELEGELERMRASLEGHENAHRVLEQTIMDRLPRVEARLAEARRLVLQRDREVARLSQTAEKQARALDEANLINTKSRDEVLRLGAALTTRAARAARDRDGYGEDRNDGEVALRTELESLRAKTREQDSMIARLQGLLGRTGGRLGLGVDKKSTVEGLSKSLLSGEVEPLAMQNADEEIARLRSELAESEALFRSLQTSADAGQENASRLAAEISKLKSDKQDVECELRQLRAELKAYKAAETDDKAMREGKIAMRARIASLEAQTKEQSETIQRLRAEIAASNERAARQAAHFTDELKRLGAGTYQTSASPRRSQGERTAKRTLTERITDPASVRSRPDASGKADENGSEPAAMARASGFLRALEGGEVRAEGNAAVAESSSSNGTTESGGEEKVPETAGASDSAAKAPGKEPRRGGLLERIIRSDRAS